MIDFRQLRYFKAVAEAGGFTRAASRLNIAQSALSLHVGRLEEQLGVKLFVREAGGIRPTIAGTKLLDHARIIFGQLALAEREVRDETVNPSGIVSIGIPSGAARVLAGPLLSAGKKDLPRVSIRIVDAMTGYLEDWLSDGRLDLALLYRPCGTADPEQQLVTESFYLVSPADCDLEGMAVRFAALAGLPLALPSGGNNARAFLSAQARKRHQALKVEYELDSLHAILDLVKQRRAHAVLTPPAFLNEWSRGEVSARAIVDPGIQRAVVLEVGRDDAESTASAAVEAVLRQTIRDLVTRGDWLGELPDGLDRHSRP